MGVQILLIKRTMASPTINHPGIAASLAGCTQSIAQMNLSDARRGRKYRATKLSKRRQTLLKKVHQLQRDCDVDVCIVVRSRRTNQVWRYSNDFVPPTEQELLSTYPVPIILKPMDVEMSKC